MHEIKIGNFRLGFQKFGDTNFSVQSAGKWIMLSFSLEEKAQKVILCRHNHKKAWHTHMHTGQPQSAWDTGLLHISFCSLWPVGLLHFGDDRAHCGDSILVVVVSSDRSAPRFKLYRWLPRVPSTVPLKVLNHLFSFYYKIVLKMHSFNSSHHCNIQSKTSENN